MNNKIIFAVYKLLKEIKEKGITINNTKELQNKTIILYPNKMDSYVEEEVLRSVYNDRIENYEDRKELEATHYKRLTAALIHEMTRTQWFTNFDKKQAVLAFAKNKKEAEKFNKRFDLKDFSGRRNLIHSLDCISSIQMLCRPEKNTMTAVIRSSDVVRLLPIDLLFLTNLMKTTLEFHEIKANKADELHVLIVSAHYYLKDNKIVDKLLE